MSQLKFAHVLAAFGVALCVGFAAVVVTGSLALRELKVGGPVYERIVLGKDLIAGTLPPPEYVIEAYEATLSFNDPASAKKTR